jgi:hypothetical protein
LGKRWVNFDAEVSADGQTLYAVDSRSSAAGAPLTADLFIARKRDGAFERTADSDNLRRLVNATELEYAPAVSSDGWSCSSRASTRFAPMPSRASGVPSGAACGSRLPRRNSSAPFQASLKRPLSRRTACRFTTTRA